MQGDGDTKSIVEIYLIKPHGHHITVTKKECVGHVAKHLKYLCQKGAVDEFGKKFSFLAKKKRSHLEKIQIKKIDHFLQTKTFTISFVQREIYMLYIKWMHTNQYINEPAPTNTNPKIPQLLAKYYKLTFEALVRRDLIEKCITQNENDSFHNTIRSMSTKSSFASSNTVSHLWI